MEISALLEAQRAFFKAGKTLPLSAREEALSALQQAVRRHEKDLEAALQKDLGKSPQESYMCEIGLLLAEIAYVKKHLRRWARPQKVSTPLTSFPARSFVLQEPYGVVLIMSPWNYPVLLTLEPLVGALAAGNCAVIKPSAYSPATSECLQTIVQEAFEAQLVFLVTGGRAENQSLLEQRFDYIFFTGGVSVGKVVMQKAAQHLTPVTLELGGKSPCIIDHTADLKLAAKRLAFGKWLNCGQTCIAPDYVLIEKSIHDAFLVELKEAVGQMYGTALQNQDYGHIINQKHFERLCGLIDRQKVVLGGATDASTLQIEPTILDQVSAEDKVMQEEIFGPILPLITVENTDEAFQWIQGREKPLALYLFSNDKATQHQFMHNLAFGGGCINDTIMHIASSTLPFGGVGNSGMGAYHGKYSFQTFSHAKAVVKRGRRPDIALRYQPYSRCKSKLMHWFLR